MASENIGSVKVTYKPNGLDLLRRGLQNIEFEPELAEAFQQWQRVYRAFLRARYVKFSRGGGDWKKLADSTVRARRKGKTFIKEARAIKAKKVFKAPKLKVIKASKPSKRKFKWTAKNVVSRLKKAKKSTSRAAKTHLSNFNKVRKHRIKQLAEDTKHDKKVQKEQDRVAKSHEREKKAIGRVQHAILRDTGQMFAAFQPMIREVKGLLSSEAKLGFAVKFGGTGSYAGGTNIDAVMNFHQIGAGRLPVRKLIVGPDAATAARMAGIMERAMAKVLRRRAEAEKLLHVPTHTN